MTPTSTSIGRVAVLLLAALVVVTGCAHHRALQPPPRLIRADALVREGQFIEARKLYQAVHDSVPQTRHGADAAYGLAYLNVFYVHPVPDYSQASAAFRSFVEEYAEDERCDDVRTWIRVLDTIGTLEAQNEENTQRLRTIIEHYADQQEEASHDYEQLLDSVKGCYSVKDSLNTRIRLLEEVIEEIENAR